MKIFLLLTVAMFVGVLHLHITREPEYIEPIVLCDSYKDESKLLEMSRRLGVRSNDLKSVALDTCEGK